MLATSGNLDGTRPRCECHYCTQARWKMSAHYQMQGIGGASAQELSGTTEQDIHRAAGLAKVYGQNS
jgi:predicted Rdx family selenoprotein